VERAIVPRQKLEGYLLDPAHEDGRHKARVFQSVLGIAASDWRYLQDAILAGVCDAPVSAVVLTPYGSRCTVVVPIQGLNGQRHDVVTGWLVVEDGPPRLVTAYVDL
jgi:filamentous hemagglutinin